MNGVALWHVSTLRPSEHVCLKQVATLVERISQSGVWTHPISVCEKTRLVMDGNHRLRAAEYLALVRVPVLPMNYDDERIIVRDRGHGGLFDRTRLKELIDGGDLLPYKTTAHEFGMSLPNVEIDLRLLKLMADTRHQNDPQS